VCGLDNDLKNSKFCFYHEILFVQILFPIFFSFIFPLDYSKHCGDDTWLVSKNFLLPYYSGPNTFDLDNNPFPA